MPDFIKYSVYKYFVFRAVSILFFTFMCNLFFSSLLGCRKFEWIKKTDQGSHIQSNQDASNSEHRQKLLLGLVVALRGEFNIPEGTNLRLKSEVILRKLEVQLALMEKDLKADPQVYGSAQVDPSLIVEAIDQSFVRDYVIDKHSHKVLLPKTDILYTIDRAAVIPLLSKLVTSYIRKNPLGSSFKQKAIGATPLASGPKKNLIFKAIQRENPQMDPSHKMDNVYMVADFHRLTLTSIYLDDAQDARNFLAFSKLSEQLPRLERIVLSAEAMKIIAESLHFSAMMSPRDYPQGLRLVLTDAPNKQFIDMVKATFDSYKHFAGLFSGIGFLGHGSINFNDLKPLLDSHKIRSLEINTEQINNNTIEPLKALSRDVILYPRALISAYYLELEHLASNDTRACLWYSKELESLVSKHIRLNQGLLLRGINASTLVQAESPLSAIEMIKIASKHGS